MKLGDIPYGTPFKALVFGRSKIGKTFGVGTFPRPNILDFDSGSDTLKGADFVRQHGYKPDILVERFKPDTRDAKGVVIQHNALDDACRYFEDQMKPGKVDQFDTWVIDTGTTLFEAAMAKGAILLGGPNAKRDIGISSLTHANARATGLLFPKMQDYGAERSMAEQFIYMVLSTNKNVVLLCHEYEETTEDGQVLGYRPLLRGGSKEAVGAHFTEIYRVITQMRGPNIERILQTKPVGSTQVGSRLGIPDGTPWHWGAIQEALKANAQLLKGS